MEKYRKVTRQKSTYYKAVVYGIATLPAYLLSDEEAEAILVGRLPPGQGLDWGQSRRAENPQGQPHRREATPASPSHRGRSPSGPPHSRWR